MIASGIRYACQTGSRAPAKTLTAPTGAKLGGWGIRRAIAPSTANDNATGREFEWLVINPDYKTLFFLAHLPDIQVAQAFSLVRKTNHVFAHHRNPPGRGSHVSGTDDQRAEGCGFLTA